MQAKAYAITPAGRVPLPATGGDVHRLFDSAPVAVYSGLRSYHGDRFFRLEAHFARTERCLAELGWPGLDRLALRRELDQAARELTGDVRVRFDVLSRPIPAGAEAATLLLAVASLEEPPESTRRLGASLALEREIARPTPRLKTSDWVIARRRAALRAPHAYEHLLVGPGGELLEGTSSNFYGVRGATVITADGGVLEGITRQVILELCSAMGIPAELDTLTEDELGSLEEAFITSASREVVPVTHIDDVVIGRGKPGPITMRLVQAYRAKAEAEAARAWPAM